MTAIFPRADVFRAACRKGFFAVFPVVLLCTGICVTGRAQSGQILGSIIGRVRLENGDSPPQRVLVNLEVRGAPMASAYTDSTGTFGFHTLTPNAYTLTVEDDHYQRVEKVAVVEATSMSPVTFAEITLVPKKTDAETSASSAGANPNMVDARDYATRYPKPAVKEFEKGLEADRGGKRDEAIRHYRKAITIAPDFYFAHNNLGSDYLNQSDFADARQEFQRVVELNQSDAAAYFNLSNVCMLSGHVAEAQQYLDEGLRRQPDSALGQFLLGSLNLQMKKLPSAESALRRSIQLDPLMVQARLQLVNLFLKEARRDEAVAQLHEFLSAFPNSPFSDHARQLLTRLEGASKAATATPN